MVKVIEFQERSEIFFRLTYHDVWPASDFVYFFLPFCMGFLKEIRRENAFLDWPRFVVTNEDKRRFLRKTNILFLRIHEI